MNVTDRNIREFKGRCLVVFDYDILTFGSNISDNAFCNLFYSIITDSEVRHCDITESVCRERLIIRLTCKSSSIYTELPAGKNTVRTMLYNTYRAGHCTVCKYLFYSTIRCNFKRNRINIKTVTCCAAYFVHSVFFSCR